MNYCPTNLTIMAPASDYLLYAVFISYLVFAAQVLYQTRWHMVDTTSALALCSLGVVFILCGTAHIAGMFSTTKWLFREGIYMLLIAVHLVLVMTNKAGILSRMMEHKDASDSLEEIDSEAR